MIQLGGRLRISTHPAQAISPKEMHNVQSGRLTPHARVSGAGREFYIMQTMSGLKNYH